MSKKKEERRKSERKMFALFYFRITLPVAMAIKLVRQGQRSHSMTFDLRLLTY